MKFTMLLVLCFGYICMASGDVNHVHNILKRAADLSSSCKSFIQDKNGGVQVCLGTIQKKLQAELQDNLQKYHSEREVLRGKMKKTVCCLNYGLLDCVNTAVKSNDKCNRGDQGVIKDAEGASLRSAQFTINGQKEVVDCTKFDRTTC